MNDAFKIFFWTTSICNILNILIWSLGDSNLNTAICFTLVFTVNIVLVGVRWLERRER